MRSVTVSVSVLQFSSKAQCNLLIHSEITVHEFLPKFEAHLESGFILNSTILNKISSGF